MPDLPDILSSIVNIEHKPRLARAFLSPLDLPDGEYAPWDSGESNASAIAFQYWPETIQDSRQTGWSSDAIPGGSHPIRKWVAGGDRSISFTAIFSTDTEPSDSKIDDFEVYDGPSDGRNIDLRTCVSWLRWFTYPSYGGDAGAGYRVYEPAKALLVLPNTSIGHDGTDHIVITMDQVDVTYQALFPSGFPRIVEVSLSMNESVQRSSRVKFHDRRAMIPSTFVGRYLNPKANEQ